MQLHQLKPLHKPKKKKRVGRGGKRGTYSGRGVKGQKSRAGRKLKPIIREILKKYPKLRGYSFKSKKQKVIVNLKDIEKKFKEGERVNPQTLFEKGLITRISGKIPKSVKILAKGTLTKKLIFEKCQFSKKAKEIIEKTKSEIL
jgi:large subunit ribosomal protein L15